MLVWQIESTTMNWKQRFDAWVAYSNRVRAMADRVNHSRREQAFGLAASVGIHRDMCCIHNASIDDDMKGWRKGNPQRLKVAKRVAWMLDEWQWQPTRLADAISRKSYKRIVQE